MSLAWGQRICLYDSLLTWCYSNKFIQPLLLFSSVFFQNNYQMYYHNRYQFLKRYNNTLFQPVFSRETEPTETIYIYREPREIDFRIFTHTVVRTSKAGSTGAGWTLRVDVVVLKENSSSRKHVLFLRTSTDYMRLTHIIKGDVLSLKATHYKY